MTKFQDLTGLKFGRLIVLKLAFKKQRNKKGVRCYWLCKCECGNTVNVLTDALKSGHTKSCGCLGKEKRLEANITHNFSNNRLYNIWSGMKSRCFNKNNKQYKNYGGRGISICNEWENSFIEFYNWAVNNGYKENLTIDRIDVNGNYCPENCRWATSKEQARNTRKNHTITYNGETHCIAEWAEILDIKYSTLTERVRKNWSIEDKFQKPVKWIRNKEDIEREFPSEMAQGAEKYFKQNYTCIGNINNLLLTVNN